MHRVGSFAIVLLYGPGRGTSDLGVAGMPSGRHI